MDNKNGVKQRQQKGQVNKRVNISPLIENRFSTKNYKEHCCIDLIALSSQETLDFTLLRFLLASSSSLQSQPDFLIPDVPTLLSFFLLLLQFLTSC